MNVLVLGGWIIGESVALELVGVFLNSKYTGEKRRRLEKVKAIEGRYSAKAGPTRYLA